MAFAVGARLRIIHCASYRLLPYQTSFPVRVVLQALGSPRQFDYVADLMVNLQVVSFIYSRATSLKGCKVSEAQLRRETLLRLLLPLNDQV